MAFWRVAGFAQPSPIEQILDKEDFTLEELLDEDDVVQEARALNARLIAFLRERASVERLIKYAVGAPSDPDDPKQQYKYPFAACEVLCCEVDAVYATLLEEPGLLDLLLSPLDQPPPLPPKVAGYLARAAGSLLLRKTPEAMAQLARRPGLVARLAAHLEHPSIAELTKRLAGADEAAAMAFPPGAAAWLAGAGLVPALLERLGPEWPPAAAANAADVLASIAHAQPSALAGELLDPGRVAALLERALDRASPAALVPALDVAAALLRPRRFPMLGESGSGLAYAGQLIIRGDGGDGGDDGSGGGGGGEDADGGGEGEGAAPGVSGRGGSGATEEEAAAARHAALMAMLPFLPQLVAALEAPPAGTAATQETPYGLLAPPLGRGRLAVAGLLSALFDAGEGAADAALIEAGALPAALRLFAQYPFNSLLHHEVYSMLAAALTRGGPGGGGGEGADGNGGGGSGGEGGDGSGGDGGNGGGNGGPPPVLREHALNTCGLPGWLAALPVDVAPAPRSGERAAGLLRAGYSGHVTALGNLLASLAPSCADVAAALAAEPRWAEFAAGELAARNAADDVGAWACGRPAADEMGALMSDGDEVMLLDSTGAPGMYRFAAIGGGGLGSGGGALADAEEGDDDDGGGAGVGHEPMGYAGALAGALATMPRLGLSDSDSGGGGGGGGGSGSGGDLGSGGGGGAVAPDASAGGDGEGGGASSSGGGGGAAGDDAAGWGAIAAPAGAPDAADTAVLLAGSDDEDAAGISSALEVPLAAAAGAGAAGAGAAAPDSSDAAAAAGSTSKPAEASGDG